MSDKYKGVCKVLEPTRITVYEAKERMDRGEPLVFIDSRNSQAWAKSLITLPGALRVPADEVKSHLEEIAPNRAIVTYCT